MSHRHLKALLQFKIHNLFRKTDIKQSKKRRSNSKLRSDKKVVFRGGFLKRIKEFQGY